MFWFCCGRECLWSLLPVSTLNCLSRLNCSYLFLRHFRRSLTGAYPSRLCVYSSVFLLVFPNKSDPLNPGQWFVFFFFATEMENQSTSRWQLLVSVCGERESCHLQCNLCKHGSFFVYLSFTVFEKQKILVFARMLVHFRNFFSMQPVTTVTQPCGFAIETFHAKGQVCAVSPG